MLMTAVIASVVSFAAARCSKPPTAPSPGGPNSPTVPNGPTAPLPTPNISAVFVGAGDIADCPGGADATASLIDRIGGDVYTLGDNAYPNGSAENYAGCFDRSWGRHRGRIHPAPGNHEYNTPNAAGYFGYFGDAAGPYGLGYYSFNLGAWHIVSLNSNYAPNEGNINVGAGGAQAAWLRADLAMNQQRCTLAFWHHPLFSSGQNGDNPPMRELFRILYEANADLLLSGHDHLYERFAPQDPDGRNDPARGIRQFIVGTGGVGFYRFMSRKPNSEQQIADSYGVLKLTLNPDNYQFEFITPGGTRDMGSGPCH